MIAETGIAEVKVAEITIAEITWGGSRIPREHLL